MSRCIPNSTQIPNIFFDEVLALLTTEEFVVMAYICRRIYGFNKERGRVSLTQITKGTVHRKTGQRLDRGCPISRALALRALDSLKKANLIIEVEPNDQHTKEGACYAIQMDSEAINFDWLNARNEHRIASNQRRQETMSSVRVSNQSPADEFGSSVEPNCEEIGSAVEPKIGSSVEPVSVRVSNRSQPFNGNQEEIKKEIKSSIKGGLVPVPPSPPINPDRKWSESENWRWLERFCFRAICAPPKFRGDMEGTTLFLEQSGATEEQREQFEANWPRWWKCVKGHQQRPKPADVWTDWYDVLALSQPTAKEQVDGKGYETADERRARKRAERNATFERLRTEAGCAPNAQPRLQALPPGR